MAEIAAAVDFWKVEQGGVGVSCLALRPLCGGGGCILIAGGGGGECSLRRFAPPVGAV